jgi:glycosyltransferase involved in cell wall biosynthesis
MGLLYAATAACDNRRVTGGASSSPLSIGYASKSADLGAPGDRRRFVHYAARRGIAFEIAHRSKRYDLVVATAMTDLGVWRSLPPDIPLVFDLVDSYLAVPRTQWRAALRGVAKFAFRRTRGLHLDYRGLIEDMCRRADAVVCATEEQRQDILAHCPNVHVILDFQTEIPAAERTRYAAGDPFRLVWEGLPWNLAAFQEIRAALRDVASRHPLALDVVTALERPRLFDDLGRSPTEPWARPFLGIDDVTFHAWTRENFAATCARADLAVIPLSLEDPFMRGKPENKLVGFWRQGLPVVTSATPAYERAMRGAGLDLTCRTPAEWVEALERLVTSEPMRAEAGRRGHGYAEAEYGEAVLLARWDRVLASLPGSARGQ